MRSAVPPAPVRRGYRVVAALAAFLFVLSVSAPAALAHDPASGTAAVTITIRSGLSDRDVRVSAGDIVRFVNRDGERHRMRSRSRDGFDTGDLEPGEAYQVRLSAAGTYTYLDERDEDAATYRGRIVVVASGDAGSGGSTGGETGVTPPSGGSAGGSSAGSTGDSVASSATVAIGDDFFQPTSVRIATGGTVTFRNTGGDEHSATSSAFDTGVLGEGASAREIFPTAGTFAFLCIFHSDMRGTVEVIAPNGGGGTTAPEAPRPTPTPTPTADPAPTSDPALQLAGAPSAVTVDAADFAFRPATIDVAAGGQVTWTNGGLAPHSATSKDGAFDSGLLEAGATFARTFETPGSYAYLCAFHPEMTAMIRVVAASTGSGAGVEDGPASAAGGAASTPSAAPSGQAAPAGGAAPSGPASPPVDPPAPTAILDDRPTTDNGSLAGIVLSITLVSMAAALFSRLIRGTVRRPE